MTGKINTRICVVLGPDLYKVLLENALANDRTPSDELRHVLAARYKIKPPEIKEGNPNASKALRLADAANPKKNGGN